jgi:hypothetical protein
MLGHLIARDSGPAYEAAADLSASILVALARRLIFTLTTADHGNSSLPERRPDVVGLTPTMLSD